MFDRFPSAADDRAAAYPAGSKAISRCLGRVFLAPLRHHAGHQNDPGQGAPGGLTDLVGSEGEVNVQGEVQQKLDVYANEVLLYALAVRESMGILASEENEHPLTIPTPRPSQVCRDLRSAGWFLEHRHGRQRGHHVFHPQAAGRERYQRRVAVGCCSPARVRWRPAMSFTAPRPCWSIAWATACMGSRSILRSAPSC